MTLIDKIKKVRADLEMNQKQFGVALEVSDKSISAYESGRAEPPLKILKKIAVLGKKPILYFLDDEYSGKQVNKDEILQILEGVREVLDEIKDRLTEEDKTKET